MISAQLGEKVTLSRITCWAKRLCKPILCMRACVRVCVRQYKGLISLTSICANKIAESNTIATGFEDSK